MVTALAVVRGLVRATNDFVDVSALSAPRGRIEAVPGPVRPAEAGGTEPPPAVAEGVRGGVVPLHAPPHRKGHHLFRKPGMVTTLWSLTGGLLGCGAMFLGTTYVPALRNISPTSTWVVRHFKQLSVFAIAGLGSYLGAGLGGWIGARIEGLDQTASEGEGPEATPGGHS